MSLVISKYNIYLHIIFKNKKISIKWKKSYFSILDALNKNYIKIKSQCFLGMCGICKIFLIQGKIKYIYGSPILKLNKNIILSCCCFPITNLLLRI